MVSNRGPLSFRRGADGSLEASRGGGGLVSSLTPLLSGTGATWVAAASSDEDREAVGRGLMRAEGISLVPVVVDTDTYRMAYDVVSNSTLWFLHHNLYDLPRRPRFDRAWRQAWSGYRRFNDAFADAVAAAAPAGAAVLVQDYHLSLAGLRLAQLRPDLRSLHFSHTPFASPSTIRVLPEAVAEELMEAMASYVACGFHCARWARAFEDCGEEVISRRPRSFVAPLGPDREDLVAAAATPECRQQGERLDALIAGRQVILRVDRVELSKNLVRGFLAFEELLEAEPGLRDSVVFLALVYPSREGLAEYLAYKTEVETTVARINGRWSSSGPPPVLLDISDNYPRSVAALQRYDVLLVNPVRDGLNLVAKEGPLVNRRDGTLVLSREAGSWDELHESALGVNPFDVTGTAQALSGALCAGAQERRQRATALREASARRTPRDWLEDQLGAAAG